MSMTLIKNRLRAFFGAHEDSSGTINGEVGQILTRNVVYEFPPAVKAAAVTLVSGSRMQAQTGSLSATQPLGARTVFIASKPCKVTEITFAQIISATTSASYTTSWSIIINKRGGTIGTYSSSNTYSVTTFVGGLASVTAAAGAHDLSGSYTGLVKNVAFAPNKFNLSSTASKLQLKKGQILTARVAKGKGGTSNGAIFFGGTLKIQVEEE